MAPIPLLHENLPSIAVLPLHNFGRDPADDYFADGIVEDVILSLARLRELLVISRGSTSKYRGPGVDPREVGRDLGVRYVLGGSVRKAAQRLRVSTQLYDAETGGSLWTKKMEFEPGDLFEAQDQVVRRVVPRIAPHVRAAELRGALRKRPESFTAYDWMLRALHIINSLDVNTFLRAREFLNRAMTEDSHFAMPVAWAARWHCLRIGQGWSPAPNEEARRAAELATRAIDLDRQNALGLATYGHLKSFLFHDYDVALRYFDRALTACPNSSLAWILSSATLSYVGRGAEAVERAGQGLRLSPHDQSIFYYYAFLSIAHYSNGNYAEAIRWGRMAARENPVYTTTYRILAASLVASDRLDEARDSAAAVLNLEPDFRLGEYERTRQPFQSSQIKARYLQHLKKAGLPN
jgi:adenylate cyclase